MKIRLLAAVLLGIAACGAAAQPVAVPTPAQPRDGFVRQTQKITDHVWLIERPVSTDAPYEGNSIVFEQRDGLVVVDAGGAPVSGRYITDAIGAISAKPVRYLVFTQRP